MSSAGEILTLLCAVGAATAAGAFFTFSTFTIRGLRRLAPAQGAAAMQAINREAPTPLFMLLLFGTGATCIALMIHTATHPRGPGSTLRALACVLYLLGVVLTTVGCHVPRSGRLDRPAHVHG